MALNLGDLFSTLKLNIRPFVDSLNEATRATQGVAIRVNRVMSNTNRSFTLANRSARSFRDTLRIFARREITNNLRRLREEVKRTSAGFKDIRRIIGGIIVAQIFYRMTRQIQNLAEALMDFHINTELAQVTLTNLLGTEPKARAFLHVMEDLAAMNPTVSVDKIVDTSKKMIGMGFEAATLLDLMTVITDTTTALGTKDQGFDAIILALGQIKSQGRLAGQEVKQLGDALVPIRAILREELGLSPEDFMRLADLNIPGDLAVKAIVEGMRKRFAGMGEIVADTAYGALEIFKSNALLLFRSLTQEVFNSYRGLIFKLRDTVIEARKIVAERGLSGLFDRFVPPELNYALRAIIGSFQNLGRAVVNLWVALGPLVGLALRILINTLAIILPIVTGLIEQFTRLVRWVSIATPILKIFASVLIALFMAKGAAKALILLWKVMGLGLITKLVTKAVIQLIVALRLLMVAFFTSPKLAIIAGVIILIGILTGGFKKLSAAVGDLNARFTALFGMHLNKVLPDMGDDKKRIDNLEQFKQKYEGIGEAIKDVTDKAKKFGVASFDEVFGVSSPAEDAVGDLDDLLSGLSDADWGGELAASIEEAMENIAVTFPTFKEIFATFWTWFEDQAILFNRWVNSLPKRFARWVIRNGKALWDWFEDTSIRFHDWSVETSKVIVNWVADTSKAFGRWVLDTSFDLGSWMINTGKDFWRWFEDTSIGFHNWSMETLRTIGNWIKDTAFDLGSWMISTAKDFSNWIIDSSIAFNKWSTDTLKIIGDWILETARNFGNWIIDSSIAFNQWSTDSLKSFANWIDSSIKSFANWIIESSIAFHDWSVETSIIIANWVKDTAFDLGSWMLNTLSGFRTWAEDSSIAFHDWSTETLKSIGEWIIEAPSRIRKGLEDMAIAFNLWVTENLTAIKDWGKQAPQKFKEGVESLGSLIVDTFTDWGLKLRDWLHQLGATIYEEGADWWSTLKRLGDDRLDTALAPFRRLRDGIKEILGGLKNFFRDTLNNHIIDPVNTLIDRMNTLSFNAPSWLGGGTYGIDLKKIPQLRTGGLVQRDTLARLGEGNKKEAVIPLERTDVVKQFASAIAEVLGSREDSTGPNYYMIGTLIGDDRSLTELERRLQVTRLNDQLMMGGA